MKLKDITKKRLVEVLLDILPDENYSEVSPVNEEAITAISTSGLVQQKSLIIPFVNPLTGDDSNHKDAINLGSELVKIHKPDTLLFVLSNTISQRVSKEFEAVFKINVRFIQFEELDKLILKHHPNFYTYESFDLTNYEKHFLEEMAEKSALRQIQGLEEKVQKLLDIYISPKILEVKDDLEHRDIQFAKTDESKISLLENSAILEGDTGSGKSSIFREIGKFTIKSKSKRKCLPVIINAYLLTKSNFSIKGATETLLEKTIGGNWDSIIKSYDLLILVDGIDEVENSQQKNVLKQLQKIDKIDCCRFIVSTRAAETVMRHLNSTEVSHFQIQKFDDSQVKKFIAKFFESESIGDELLQALKDNRILERLPLTPLSISLIALVFEKGQREIPATISDIYDNFNNLILGKLTAVEKFKLIEFNYRERILSLFAIELFNHPEYGFRMVKEDFINYFINYFKNKRSDIHSDVLEEFLDYFISASGILEINDGNIVSFSHKSFLEYYASLEYFKHIRDADTILMNKFLDLNWQNVAIFYAGRSKDMPEFLKSLIDKVRSAKTFQEEASGVMGLGYILQALYQTDNNLRALAVEAALETHLSLHDSYKKMTTEGDTLLFQKIRLPVLSVVNMYMFYLSYLSATLKTPMGITFNKLLENYKKSKSTSEGYKLLTLAAVFHSRQLQDSSYLEVLLDDTAILNDPYLTTVANFALAFDNKSHHKELKKTIRKAIRKNTQVVNALLDKPASQLRFTPLDMISGNRKVKIITEGKSDAIILEHAFSILTGRQTPYWEIMPSGINDGSADEVRMTLLKSSPIANEDIIIGIFDNDGAGIEQFKSLLIKHFELLDGSQSVAKIKSDKKIYGMKLPIPVDLKQYKQDEIKINYFAIEHYFDLSLLQTHNMIKESTIEGVYQINGGKTNFAKEIVKLKDPKFFHRFLTLFNRIDTICGVDDINYKN